MHVFEFLESTVNEERSAHWSDEFNQSNAYIILVYGHHDHNMLTICIRICVESIKIKKMCPK